MSRPLRREDDQHRPAFPTHDLSSSPSPRKRHESDRHAYDQHQSRHHGHGRLRSMSPTSDYSDNHPRDTREDQRRRRSPSPFDGVSLSDRDHAASSSGSRPRSRGQPNSASSSSRQRRADDSWRPRVRDDRDSRRRDTQDVNRVNGNGVPKIRRRPWGADVDSVPEAIESRPRTPSPTAPRASNGGQQDDSTPANLSIRGAANAIEHESQRLTGGSGFKSPVALHKRLDSRRSDHKDADENSRRDRGSGWHRNKNDDRGWRGHSYTDRTSPDRSGRPQRNESANQGQGEDRYFARHDRRNRGRSPETQVGREKGGALADMTSPPPSDPPSSRDRADSTDKRHKRSPSPSRTRSIPNDAPLTVTRRRPPSPSSFSEKTTERQAKRPRSNKEDPELAPSRDTSSVPARVAEDTKERPVRRDTLAKRWRLDPADTEPQMEASAKRRPSRSRSPSGRKDDRAPDNRRRERWRRNDERSDDWRRDRDMRRERDSTTHRWRNRSDRLDSTEKQSENESENVGQSDGADHVPIDEDAGHLDGRLLSRRRGDGSGRGDNAGKMRESDSYRPADRGSQVGSFEAGSTQATTRRGGWTTVRAGNPGSGPDRPTVSGRREAPRYDGKRDDNDSTAPASDDIRKEHEDIPQSPAHSSPRRPPGPPPRPPGPPPRPPTSTLSEPKSNDGPSPAVGSATAAAQPRPSGATSSLAPPQAEPGEGYERIGQVGEGTYGQVFKARSEKTGILVALKRIRMESEKDGFPVTAMREIKLLQGLRHENVVRLHEMMTLRSSVYMVFEYMEHDLSGVIGHPQIRFTEAHLKSLSLQLLEGLRYLHHKAVLHRDLKGSNLLLNNQGLLKLADFGLARLYAKRRQGDYTNRVVTLWYRPPELLFGTTRYGPEIDTWGAGCILLELFTKRPVFQGQDEVHQLQVLNDVLGPFSQKRWPGVDKLPWYDLLLPGGKVREEGETDREGAVAFFERAFGSVMPRSALDVAMGLLCYQPERRSTAQEALDMPYFRELPAPERPAGLLSAIEGEWHEFEARRARKKGDRASQDAKAHASAAEQRLPVSTGGSGTTGAVVGGLGSVEEARTAPSSGMPSASREW